MGALSLLQVALPLLVAGGLLFPVDPEQHGFLCVVALHLHYDVVFVGFIFGEVLFAGSAADFALFVEEVEDAP